jgi:hypothetical protein
MLRLQRGILAPDRTARHFMNLVDSGPTAFLLLPIRTMIGPIVLAQAAIRMLQTMNIQILPLLRLFSELSVSETYSTGSVQDKGMQVSEAQKYLDGIPGQQSCVLTSSGRCFHDRWGTARTIEGFKKRRRKGQEGILVLRSSPALGGLITPVLKFDLVAASRKAGIGGIVVEADAVAYMDRKVSEAFCEQNSMFIAARRMSGHSQFDERTHRGRE